MSYKDEKRYDDIIHLPHHVSDNHPQMDILDRAAQFAPFAALTGHDAAIKETARLTEERMELDDNSKEILDEQMRNIREHISEHPMVTITYFRPDEKKDGGSYVTITGRIKKIDEYERIIVLEDGIIIPVNEIVEVIEE